MGEGLHEDKEALTETQRQFMDYVEAHVHTTEPEDKYPHSDFVRTGRYAVDPRTQVAPINAVVFNIEQHSDPEDGKVYRYHSVSLNFVREVSALQSPQRIEETILQISHHTTGESDGYARGGAFIISGEQDAGTITHEDVVQAALTGLENSEQTGRLLRVGT